MAEYGIQLLRSEHEHGRLIPVGYRACRIEYTYLFLDPSNKRENDEYIAASDQVNREDIDICNALQKNLESDPSFEQGFLSQRHENGVWYFQNMVRRVVEK